MKDTFYNICAVLAIIIGVGMVGAMDAEDEKAQETIYCDMVKLRLTDPNAGWPDYAGMYRDICLK